MEARAAANGVTARAVENSATAATAGAMVAIGLAGATVVVGATAVAGMRIGDRSFKRSARLQSVRAYWPRGYPVNVVMQS